MNTALILSLLAAGVGADKPPDATPGLALPHGITFPTQGKPIAVSRGGAAAAAKSLCIAYKRDGKVVERQVVVPEKGQATVTWRPAVAAAATIAAMPTKLDDAAECEKTDTAVATLELVVKPALVLPKDLKYPVTGEAVTITLHRIPALCFVYQPDSRVVKLQTMATAGKTQVSWKPERHGIVTIRAMTQAIKDPKQCHDKKKVAASIDVSVKFSGLPLSGVLIFFGAGLILFGGVWFSMRLIFAGTG